MEYTLTMTFITQTGDKGTMSISDIREDITKEEAMTLMDAIISENIFTSKNGDYVSKYGAKVVQRDTTVFEIN